MHGLAVSTIGLAPYNFQNSMVEAEILPNKKF